MTREERNLEICRLYAEDGLTLRGLADRFEMSIQGVRSVLLKAGVEMRAWGSYRRAKVRRPLIKAVGMGR